MEGGEKRIVRVEEINRRERIEDGSAGFLADGAEPLPAAEFHGAGGFVRDAERAALFEVALAAELLGALLAFVAGAGVGAAPVVAHVFVVLPLVPDGIGIGREKPLVTPGALRRVGRRVFPVKVIIP